MKSRMEKYYNNNVNAPRALKNQQLYNEINNGKIEEFELSSNVAILENNSPNIDVEKLKAMLDRKYREEPKRKSIPVDIPEEIIMQDIDETHENDINSILQKARQEKLVDYDRERLKKLRDTQYDILKSLDLDNSSEEKEEIISDDEKKLLSLINTITEKEFLKKEQKQIEEGIDPLDILTDLKGSENTGIIEPVKIDTASIDPETIKEVVKEEVQNQIDKSFYTTATTFTQSDFDDFNDLKEDVKSSKTLITILIILIIIGFVIGAILFVNTVFDLGLF